MAAYYNPYESVDTTEGSWLQTNLHVHTRIQSHLVPYFDIEFVLAGYKAAGYHLIMDACKDEWSDTSAAAQQVGVATLNGQEYVEKDGILLVGTQTLHTGSPQQVVDGCLAEGGFAIICHPNQRYLPPPIPPLLPRTEAEALVGPIGVEVYNGCISRRLPTGSSLASDFWDDRLTAGAVLWGFGSDDFHDLFEMHVGWSVIWASSATLQDVKAAAHRGSLYASTGLRSHGFRFDGTLLEVEADQMFERVNRTTYRFIGEGGKILGHDYGETGRYQLNGDEAYVRAEATGEDGSMLWYQPLLDSERYARELLRLGVS